MSMRVAVRNNYLFVQPGEMFRIMKCQPFSAEYNDIRYHLNMDDNVKTGMVWVSYPDTGEIWAGGWCAPKILKFARLFK